MSCAFLVFVHKNPQQVKMLITALEHQDFYFFIHVDKKMNLEKFKCILECKNTHLIEDRTSIIWASFRFTDAIFRGIQTVLNHPRNFDRITLISGQCFPIKSAHQISDFFNKHKDTSYIACEPLDSDWYKEAKLRYQVFHLTSFNLPGKHRIQDLLNFFLPKRKQSVFDIIYGGPNSSWWSMTQEACAYALNYYLNNQNLRNFFRFTWGSDEIVIPSILYNSSLKKSISNKGICYINWTEGGAHPKILTSPDFSQIFKSDYLFARKFDITKNSEIIDRIAKRIASEL